jgi:hypothetical protein
MIIEETSTEAGRGVDARRRSKSGRGRIGD